MGGELARELGLQRELPGQVWETLTFPSWPEIVVAVERRLGPQPLYRAAYPCERDFRSSSDSGP